MRHDVTTRQCNAVTERFGAALSKKTEPSRPLASPNKGSKLEAVIVQRKQEEQGTRDARGNKMREETCQVTLLVIRDRMVLINNDEPLTLFRESLSGFLELSVDNVFSESTRD
jgi:hypothetical protein